jgi:hypothetical protein
MAIGILVPLILGLVSLMGAIDLAYHLRTGEMIIAEGELPVVDTYTFTAAGTPWVDQQWGAQVILTAAFRLGGWPGLVAFQGVLGALSFAFVLLAARERGASARTATILTLSGFLLAYPMITLRPQLVGLPLLGATLWVLASRHRAPSRVWLVPAFAVVLANIHGSFTLLPLLVGLAWADDLMARRGGRRMFAVFLATVVGTLVNPFGVEVWRYAFDLSTDPIIRDSITEWAPVTIGSALGAATILSALTIAAYFARRRTPVGWIDIITLGAFLLLAFSASRAVLWWAMVAPIVVAGVAASGAAAPDAEADEARTPKVPAFVLIGGLLVAVLAVLPWWRGSGYAEHLEAAPPGVTDALANAPSGSRLFAHQPWGSWFVYALPEHPVFVDSRIEIMPASIWEDYFEVAYAGARWKDALNRWDPDFVIANKEEWKSISLLRNDKSWEVFYEDDESVVFSPAD